MKKTQKKKALERGWDGEDGDVSYFSMEIVTNKNLEMKGRLFIPFHSYVLMPFFSKCLCIY